MAITPKPANGVSGTYQGDPGTNSRYYWIQAIYPSSRAVLSSPVLVPNIASLNPYNNKVSISWRQVPGAIGYDVIVTTTSTEPTVNSTTTIGLIFGTTSTSFTDQGQVLQSWTYETGTGVVAVGAAGPDGAIQYNAGSSVFGGSADFTRDLVTGVVVKGLFSDLDSSFAAQTYGPTDPIALGVYQVGTGPLGLITAIQGDGTTGEALGLYASGGLVVSDDSSQIATGVAGLGYAKIPSGKTIGPFAEFTGWVAAFDAYTIVEGPGTLAAAIGLQIHNASVVSGGTTIDKAYGILVRDQDAATNNWAIQTGLGLVAFGGNPITPFQGLYVGPDESTLNAEIQGWTSPHAVLVTAITNATFYSGLGVATQTSVDSDTVGIYGVSLVLNANRIGKVVAGDGVIGAANASTYSFVAGSYVMENIAAHQVDGINITAPTLDDGATLTNFIGISVEDQTLATNNWAFKSGAGMVEVGDATKAAGIHVLGAGAFDVTGGGYGAMLWADQDNDAVSYGLALSNRTAGLAHTTGLQVLNNGDFLLSADDFNGGVLQFSIASQQWQFIASSIQSASWISTLRNTAPADGDIAANEMAMWFSPTNGAAFVSFKGKTADGTVVTLKEGIGTSSAPSTSTIVLPTSVYGGSAQLLGGPTAWETVIKNGTTYKRPLY